MGKKKLSSDSDEITTDTYSREEIEDRLGKYGTVYFPEEIKESVDDIKGNEIKKERLEDFFKALKKYREVAEQLKKTKLNPSLTVLLYGPPGTGKTSLTRAFSKKYEVPICVVESDRLVSPLLGDTIKNIRNVVELAGDIAKKNGAFVLFFDEIDALAGIRGGNYGVSNMEQIVSQLLTEMDGLEELNNVILLAATNRPDILDPALLRSGRFGRHIQFEMPDFLTRKKIFEVHLKDKPISEDVNTERLTKLVEGFSGADMKAVCQEAILLAIRNVINVKNFDNKVFENSRNLFKIKNSEFEKAIEKINISVKRAQKSYQADLKEPIELLYR